MPACAIPNIYRLPRFFRRVPVCIVIFFPSRGGRRILEAMKTIRAFLSSSPINSDVALLVLRVGIGLSMIIFHGWGKITGGPELWGKVGGNMSHLGIGFAPVFWGFLAAAAESVASALLILGVLFRPATAALVFTMVVAVLTHLNMPPDAASAGWKGASHALELLCVYVALLLTGPGRYALMRPVVDRRTS